MNAQHRILIVEDEPNVRLVLRMALESAEHEVSEAADGLSALLFLEKSDADVVLLDLLMPELGGMEVLRRIREAGNCVPVVIVTAHGSIPDAVAAMRLGAFDFLAKPMTPDVLRNVVADVLKRKASAPPNAKEPAHSEPSVASAATDIMAQAKYALNHRRFDHAESLLSQAIGRNPKAAEAHYLLGVLHELRDKPDAAYASYRSALNADAGFEPAKLHLMKYFKDRIM